ncbi:MAG: GNAT family N-acetyltransferase [Bacteroidetes bacterium]|nr:GNAT family N-acetyltransferase [Bacteroidota bacterium]MBS1739069.1 GNAT family N-acetyltransferase [Bacteroidota bacterium]
MTPLEVVFKDYTITSDKTIMDIHQIHDWLSNHSYWSQNIPFETVKQAFDYSFCIGAMLQKQQIAFARLVTDYATFGYLADVFVIESHRGKGIGKIMLSQLLNQLWVKRLRRIMLATLDAHDLYKMHGFLHTAFPERFMEINRPNIYRS